MRNSWRLRLAVLAGLAWTSAAVARTPATRDPAGERQGPTLGAMPAGWNATPERPEPGGQPGLRLDSTDETRMVEGDLSAGPGSRWLGDILVTDPTYDQ
ncbi:MAG: hypothetical protein JXO22_01980, partial [Phycisphaerae bacterium]|nr:hypothetical protein [Phycisphaerae bacterium]